MFIMPFLDGLLFGWTLGLDRIGVRAASYAFTEDERDVVLRIAAPEEIWGSASLDLAIRQIIDRVTSHGMGLIVINDTTGSEFVRFPGSTTVPVFAQDEEDYCDTVSGWIGGPRPVSDDPPSPMPKPMDKGPLSDLEQRAEAGDREARVTLARENRREIGIPEPPEGVSLDLVPLRFVGVESRQRWTAVGRQTAFDAALHTLASVRTLWVVQSRERAEVICEAFRYGTIDVGMMTGDSDRSDLDDFHARARIVVTTITVLKFREMQQKIATSSPIKLIVLDLVRPACLETMAPRELEFLVRLRAFEPHGGPRVMLLGGESSGAGTA